MLVMCQHDGIQICNVLPHDPAPLGSGVPLARWSATASMSLEVAAGDPVPVLPAAEGPPPASRPVTPAAAPATEPASHLPSPAAAVDVSPSVRTTDDNSRAHEGSEPAPPRAAAPVAWTNTDPPPAPATAAAPVSATASPPAATASAAPESPPPPAPLPPSDPNPTPTATTSTTAATSPTPIPIPTTTPDLASAPAVAPAPAPTAEVEPDPFSLPFSEPYRAVRAASKWNSLLGWARKVRLESSPGGAERGWDFATGM